MLRKALFFLLLIGAAFAAAQGGINQAAVQGSVGANPQLAGVSVEQELGAKPPMDVPLVDDAGKPTTPAGILHGRPLVLLPIFYRCNGVCTTEMQGVLGALGQNPGLKPGRDLDVVVLGLNPKETPGLAAAKKSEYIDQYGDRKTAAGWTFLTGTQANVTRVANALGVHYAYDPVKDQVSHPSAVLVLTPEGRVSTVMTDGMYPAARFAEDVRRAGKEQLGEKREETTWLGCVHTDPITGKRSVDVVRAMRLLAVAVVGGLVAAMAVLGRSKRQGTSG